MSTIDQHHDAYFTIGTRHARAGVPCQDYALSGASPSGTYATVADGCSSGGRTDIGARLVAIAAQGALDAAEAQSIQDVQNAASVIDTVQAHYVRDVVPATRLMRLNFHDLLATRLFAWLGNEEGGVHVAGDGVVAMQYRDGSMSLSHFEWDDNLPYYPAYQLADDASFRLAHGGDPDAVRLNERAWHWDPIGDVWREAAPIDHTLREGMAGIAKPISRHELGDLTMVALMTDGITQIDGVDWKDAARSLLTFRSTTGAFLKRRMLRELQRLSRAGCNPLDDIAAAAVLHTPYAAQHQP